MKVAIIMECIIVSVYFIMKMDKRCSKVILTVIIKEINMVVIRGFYINKMDHLWHKDYFILKMIMIKESIKTLLTICVNISKVE
jgi:hypothetical protein